MSHKGPSRISWEIVLLMAAALGVACASSPPVLPDAPETSAISAATEGFSPTGNPTTRTIRLDLHFGAPEAVRSWSVRIVSGSITLKEFTGSGPDLPDSIRWDGKNEAGAVWPEGEYYAIFRVDYGETYNPSLVAWDSFTLVASPPRVSLSASPGFFTPAGDGMAEPVELSLEASAEVGKPKRWTIDILDSHGEPVRNFEGEGAQGKVAWDGQTSAGTWVEPRATYLVRAKAQDEYGNEGQASLSLSVRAQPDAPQASSIRALAPGFSPTGDPSHRSMSFALSFGNRESIRSWAVEISTGSVVLKRYSGTGANLPSALSWDGKSETGSTWPEGEYRALLSVDYGQAFNPSRASSGTFRLVSSPPLPKLNVSPPYFTPAGVGMEEPVELTIDSVSGLGKTAGWRLEILDGRGASVKTYEGAGGSGRASWDGTIKDGNFAEPASSYTVRLEARDEYGNTGMTQLELAVRDRPEAPEASLIETEARGFSPTSDKSGGKIDFSLLLGNPEALRSWRIDIEGSGGRVRSFGDVADTGPAASQGKSLPSQLSWDGEDDNGAPAAEGTYSALLTVDYGRTYKPSSVRSKEFSLVRSLPRLSLSLSPDGFTPTESGVAAPVAILLDASAPLARLDAWTLDILDAQGRLIQSYSQKWPMNQVLWDGSIPGKGFVEPGSVYGARATVADEFGNEGSANAAIRVKEIPAPTELSVIEPRSSGFSLAGTNKIMDFILVAGNVKQLKNWKVTISHAERGAQRSFSGDAKSLSRSLTWDGTTETGSPAPDGSYFATFSLDYGASFKPSSVRSTDFYLQSAPPEAILSLSPASLRPMGGGFEKPIAIELSTHSRFSEVESWVISILDPKGSAIALFKDNSSEGHFLWDGKSASGEAVKASTTYTVEAEVRDSYGNTGLAKAYLPVEDLPPVPGENAVTPAANGLSPNGDGLMDSLDLKLSVIDKAAVRSWKLAISHEEAGIQKVFSGDAASLRDAVTWLGRNDTGAAAPEGVYTAELSIDYGTTFKASSVKSRHFVLAISKPELSVKVAPESLVPDEDGFVAPAQLSLEASSPLGRIDSWKLAILDGTGTVLRDFTGAWPAQSIPWDGVGVDGSLAEPGTTYTALATVRDEFGLSAKVQAPIVVGALPAATEESELRGLAKGFSPAAKASMNFALGFGNENLIKAWRLDIEREDRTVRISYPGEATKLPSSFSWDGRLQDGTIAPDGRYVATLTIDYGRVYTPSVIRSVPFLLVANPPEASLGIDPPLFSPDGDGQNESLTMTLAASSRFAAISDWSLDIFDPGGNLFTTFRGRWPASPIVWNGKNAKGETVESAEDYPVVAHIRDEFGNSAELRSAARVDILIVKIGDGYRIRIASIVFKSFTADYLDVPADRAERNLTTLNLLAEKLKKFPGYQIAIVGHAVMINWDDPVKGKAEQEKVLIPLSRARAEAIKEALVSRGIEASRIVTEGVGASDQIVPDSDFENRWKNRRVEFFLRKKK